MKQIVKYWIWIVCATVWGTLFFVAPDFTDNPVDGWRGFLTQIAYIAACGIGNIFVLYLIGCNKYVCAVFLPIYGILGAVVSFYRRIFHVTITPMIIDVTLHTNAEEALGVISWQLIVWILINLSIVAVLCYTRFRFVHLDKAWIHALVVMLLGVGYFMGNTRLHKSLCQRYPYNIYDNIKEYMHLQGLVAENRTVPAYRVVDKADSLTVVLVLGEAVRADHLQLCGYERETTPTLAVRPNVVCFPNIYSEQTHTLASLPYILTRADSLHEEYQYSETSFVPILNNEGYYSAWISNQDLGDTFAHFLAECDTSVFANAGKSTYVFTRWLDGEMLPIIDGLEQLPLTRKLYIVHCIGSHWYYNNHVPENADFFLPVTNNRLVINNSIEQIVNSYDNTIRYMDSFMDSLIARFEDQKALVIYQADHGEALGENGEFLHANATEQAKHPACFIWYSNAFQQEFPTLIENLNANKDKRYSTDYVFYSILCAAGIEADGDNETNNIFR